jgi:diguanylate cyclase (GGDEF)-like protein
MIVIIGVCILAIMIKNRQGETSTLTISELRWIENNKNKVIDIAVINDLPIFGYEGEGVFFEFIKELQTATPLEFNLVPYQFQTKPSLGEYVFKVLKTNINPHKNQLLIYQDEYVVIGSNKNKLNAIDELSNKTIGFLSGDENLITDYLSIATNIKYTSYENKETLLTAFNNNEIELCIVPYNIFIDEILSHNNYHIVFQLREINKKYVLELSKNNKALNSIIKKYWYEWQSQQQELTYHHYLFNLYLDKMNINSKTKNAFTGRTYTYGVLKTLPYEMLVDDHLIGINGQYINKFKKFAGLEFVYINYKNINDLKRDFAAGKIDMAFNYYDMQTDNYIKTMSPFNEEYVLLGHNSSGIAVNSLAALNNVTVLVVKDTFLAKEISGNKKIKIKTFNNFEQLLHNLNKKHVVLIDRGNYEYYKNSVLLDYRVLYNHNLPKDYTFVINNRNENKVLASTFDRFIATTNYQQVEQEALLELLEDPVKEYYLKNISRYLLVTILGVLLLMRTVIVLYKRSKVTRKLKKEDKLRYTDPITNLKNRAYLNDHINQWEEGNIYPQSIIIVDLNNIKYVNDNYGHEEGDNLITKAAAILINSQLENSEIIRTDGNEFLIYLVGYTESQTLSYCRKLYKELKNLPYEFGAALGFSMIEDEIKTIDDAINEATLDMRTNKEEQKD